MSVSRQLDSITKVTKHLEVKKYLLIQKAMTSQNPSDIIKAAKLLDSIEPREKVERKSLMIDPFDFNQQMGFKNKPYSLSYNTLTRMSKTPIINAIIKTRKNQIASFCEPQSDQYSTGFVIRKKLKRGEKESKEDSKKIEFLTHFILNCGENASWEADDFDTFVRKIVQDSLTYDQMTFEVMRNRKGIPVEFIATDASSFRIADSYDDDTFYEDKRNLGNYSKKEKIKGYYPNYVQVLNNKVEAEFYPWELCFGIRNPSSSIHNYGYGTSELEEMINVITAILYSDEYNRRFFSQGSAPKGLLKVKSGSIPEAQLQQFRQQWQAMITGVMNSWKTPVIDADVEWIDLQRSNRDMEFSRWMEYLIKLACGIFAIDPNEVGFNISSSGNGTVFESNNENKLKHSQDKGLTPMLKFIQRKINRLIISQLDPQYEFVFVGMEGNTPAMELEMDVKKGQSFMTINELREKYDLKKLGKPGDMIGSPYYMQAMQAEEQKKQAEAGAQQGGDEEQNPFLQKQDGGQEEEGDEGESENPFAKAFLDELNSINKK